jgi:ammonium transporter, Amt family
LGGGFDLLQVQVLGVLAIIVFTVISAFAMFVVLNLLGRLRVHPDADKIGIDVYEHGASAWPDVYPIDRLGTDYLDADRLIGGIEEPE